MAWKFYVGGVEREVVATSLKVDDVVEERSTLSAVVETPFGVHFEKGQPVRLADSADLTIFGGRVEESDEVRFGPHKVGLLRHALRCSDHHYVADKLIVAASWENKTCGEMIADLMTGYLADEGVTEGEIQEGPLVDAFVSNYRYATWCLDEWVRLSGGAFTWWIDGDMRLFFVDRATYAAPWTLTAADALFSGVKVRKSAPLFRDRQFIRGFRDMTDPQTEAQYGDGVKQTFGVGYPIAQVPTVEEDRGSGWVAKDVGIRQVETGKDWYWSKGDATITQDTGGTALADTDQIRITYRGLFDAIVVSEDPSARLARQSVEGGGTGYVDAVEDVPDATDRATAFQIASKRLAQYVVMGRTLNFVTRRAGLKAGQLLTVNLADHDLAAADFLVASIGIGSPPLLDESDEPVLEYAVRAVQGPVDSTWTKFFSTLVNRSAAVTNAENVKAAGTLIALVSFSETWHWHTSGETSPAVYACWTPSDTRYPSDTLYPC